MMDILSDILSALSSSVVEIFVLVFTALSTMIANKIIKEIEEKKEKHKAEKKREEMKIINDVTDKVALEVDSLFPDIPYEEQREKAIEKAKAILESKKVDISYEELSIEVEDGFSKLPNYYDDDINTPAIPPETPLTGEYKEDEEVEDEIVEDVIKTLPTPLKRSTRRIHLTKKKESEEEETLFIFYSRKGGN